MGPNPLTPLAAELQELRVQLMRHWSLYEALYHSSYIASRLGLYQTKGRTKLDEWLARMGVRACRV